MEKTTYTISRNSLKDINFDFYSVLTVEKVIKKNMLKMIQSQAWAI